MPDTPSVLLLTSGARTAHPRHHHLMARSLQDAGIDVLILGQPDSTGPRSDGAVPVRYLKRRPGRVARMLSGPSVMRAAVKLKPRVIQVNSLDLLPWAVLARLVTRRPVVYDSNEDYASYMLLKQWLPAPSRKPLSWITARVEPFLAGRLDATLVADGATEERFRGKVRRLLLVHNFPWRSLAEQPISDEFKYDVLYHGSLPTYHIDAIASTARVLKDRDVPIRFCLAAREYEEEDQSVLEDRLEAAGVREMFTLFYNLPFHAMPELLAATRLGFIPLPDVPKFRSNIPRKLFEFMSVGRPAVLSDLPPSRRLIGEENCSLLVPPEPAAYADALERLYRNPEIADEMGRRGRRLILERMNAEAEVRPYVDLISKLAR
jgi:glycosyltransferase involved in cell wall biosynthesis